jgi:hypothetical protein
VLLCNTRIICRLTSSFINNSIDELKFECFSDEQFSCKLKELGPSAIDAEFRFLAPGAGGDVVLVENMMEFLINQLELRKDFELIQGYMALFLKVQYNITLFLKVQYNITLFLKVQYNMALFLKVQYNMALFLKVQYMA